MAIHTQVDAPKELEKKYDELVQNYQSQTERQRYGKHKSYAEFRSRLWVRHQTHFSDVVYKSQLLTVYPKAVFHPESNMPAVASLLPLGRMRMICNEWSTSQLTDFR